MTRADSAQPEAPPQGFPPGQTVSLDGRGTVFVRHDPGPALDARTAVVLIHGWTVTADTNFFGVYDALGERHQVVAFDQRGHGRGIRPRLRFRLEDCADDVIAIADHLGLEKVIPVGYSMGGAIAQLVAHRHPTRTAGVVLCATSRSFRGRGPEAAAWRAATKAVSVGLLLAPARARQRLLERFLLFRRDVAPQWMLDEIARNDPAFITQASSALADFDSRSWIGELGAKGTSGIPAAVLVMTKDLTVATPRQRRLADSIPGAHVFEVDADHRAAVTATDKFVPALLDALGAIAKR